MGCVQSQSASNATKQPQTTTKPHSKNSQSTTSKNPVSSINSSSDQPLSNKHATQQTDVTPTAHQQNNSSIQSDAGPQQVPPDSQTRSGSKSRLKPSNQEQTRAIDKSTDKLDTSNPVLDPELDNQHVSDSRGRRDSKSRSRTRGSSKSPHSKSRKKSEPNANSNNLLTIHEPKPQARLSVCRASASVVRGNLLQPIKITNTVIRGNGTINDYKKGKLLGEGATAKVYLYTNIRTGEEVAIKKYNRFLLKKTKMYQNDPISHKLVMKSLYDKVLHELEVLKYIHSSTNENLNHICKVHEIIDDQNCDKLYLVMEYGCLGTLSEWNDAMYHFSRDSLKTEEQARVIFLQVLKALVGLREIGIIHRDIKPQNIILTPTAAKLIDFGDAIVLPWKYPEIANQVKVQRAQSTHHSSATSPTNSLSRPNSQPHRLDINNLPMDSSPPEIQRLNENEAAHTPGSSSRSARPQVHQTPSVSNISPKPVQRQYSVSRSRSRSRINPEAFVASTNIMDLDDLFLSNPSLQDTPHNENKPNSQSASPPIVPANLSSQPNYDTEHSNSTYAQGFLNDNPCVMEKSAPDNSWYQYSKIKESPATPYFSSPESCSGMYNGFDADLWAFAATIYACVIGQLPFLSIQSNGDATLAATLELIQTGQFTWPVISTSNLRPTSLSFQALIQWMLQKDPDNRPTLDMCEQHPWAHVPISAAVHTDAH